MHVFKIQNNKACENLLLYIFKHEISRKQETHVMRLDISVGIAISSLYKHTEYDVIIFFSSSY